jgi:hypothetical protein
LEVNQLVNSEMSCDFDMSTNISIIDNEVGSGHQSKPNLKRNFTWQPFRNGT